MGAAALFAEAASLEHVQLQPIEYERIILEGSGKAASMAVTHRVRDGRTSG